MQCFVFSLIGRFAPNADNAVGYIAVVLYLRVQLSATDSFADLLTRVTEESCRAYKYADMSFVESQMSPPEFTRNAIFNWIPAGGGVEVPELIGTTHDLRVSQVEIARPLKNMDRDNEPMIILLDTENEVVGELLFSRSQLGAESMERFGRNFQMLLQEMIEQPMAIISDIVLID